MKRLALVFALLASSLHPIAAQTARDSSHARSQRVPLDSIQRFVVAPLANYCSAKWTAQYVKTACAILVRQMKAAWAAESALIASAAIVPPPAPVPVPAPDTTATTTTTPPLVIVTAPDTSHPNQPTGFSTLAYWSADVMPPAGNDGCATTCGWLSDNRSNNLAMISDATSPGSSKTVAQMKFPAGFVSGSAPGQVYTWSIQDPQMWHTQPHAVYLSFWLKISSNWVGNASQANKVIYSFINNTPSAVIEVGGADSSALVPEIVVQGIQAIQGVTLSGGAAVLAPNVKTTAMPRGSWHRWEAIFTANDSAQVNGAIQLYFDGALAVSYPAVQWTLTRHQWEWSSWDPIYGGSGPAVPADQYMWIKDFYISGK